MELQVKIAELAYQTYNSIDFVNRLKNNSLKYDFPLDDIMKKMDKKENLKILKELGYNFKLLSPGQYYNYEEEFENIKLILSCQISGGIIADYIYIYIDGTKIEGNLLKSNLAFVYRHLMNDKEAIINACKFRNFEDFRNAMSDIINIYEDFKREFLKLLLENNLLVE
jgi:hypothetical protein